MARSAVAPITASMCPSKTESYMQFVRHSALILLPVIALLGSAGARSADCEVRPTEPGVEAYCGIVAPEDMVLYRDRFLIVSSMAFAEHLYLLDSESGSLEPMTTRLDAPAPGQGWGDPSCTPPSGMQTHGLDLAQLPDGSWRLLAVNHGGRESVEMFAVPWGSNGLPELQWRGCVLAGDNAQFNDVAGLPDGGFLATDPLTASKHLPRMLMGTLRINTGRVYRWRPEAGYEVVPHTAGAYPNGILLSADGNSFYLNLYLNNEVREHDLNSGEILNRVAVTKPDNSSLGPAGQLLVASHQASVFTLLRVLRSGAAQTNQMAYDIVAIDLDSFEARPIYQSNGASLGGGTIAQALDGALYIGAFRGDRVIRVRGALAY
jgi:hypothetical protein